MIGIPCYLKYKNHSNLLQKRYFLGFCTFIKCIQTFKNLQFPSLAIMTNVVILIQRRHKDILMLEKRENKKTKSSMIFIFCDYDELLSCNVHLLFLSLSCFKDFTVNNVNLETNRQFYLFVSWLDLSCVLLNKRF